MTNATPAVSHEDGVQNGPFVQFLASRVPTALGGALAGAVSVLAVLYWLYCLVVTWIGHGNWGTPLFQTAVAAGLIVVIAGLARKTLAWLPLLVFAAAWCVFSAMPLIPIVQVIVQTASVTLMLAAAVFAVVAAQQTEKPRF